VLDEVDLQRDDARRRDAAQVPVHQDLGGGPPRVAAGE
jgi:hypothetical protein